MLRAILHSRRSLRAALVLGCLCAGLIAPSTSFAIPFNLFAPSISGTAQQGQTLTESHGTWTGFAIGYSYQWVRCNSAGNGCASISSATGSSYLVVAEDVGHKLRVEETASEPFNQSSTATSSPTAVVIPPIPTNSSLPTITGMTQQGHTLTEGNGSWTNSPTGRTYKWLRCNILGSGCAAISKATAQTYTLVLADAGHRLRVEETASNAAGSSSPAESAASGPIVPAIPENTAPPTIAGTSKPGETLSAVAGSWTNEPTGITYQWYRCNSSGAECLAIPGATSQTYTPQAADAGHALKVVETASNEGGSSPAEAAATFVPPTPAVVAKTTQSTPTSGGATISSLPTTVQSNPPIPPSRVAISARSVTISEHGSAAIAVSCPASATDGCVGSLTIRLLQTPRKRTMVVASRCARGCRPIGSAKYEARAGKRITVRVHIASYGRKQLKKQNQLRVTLTAMTFSDGQTATAVRTISLRERERGR
jgi:hypothetical protein